MCLRHRNERNVKGGNKKLSRINKCFLCAKNFRFWKCLLSAVVHKREANNVLMDLMKVSNVERV